MDIDLSVYPRSAAELMERHTNELVEARSREQEAFILASLRLQAGNVADFHLVERRSPDGLTTTWSVERKS